MNRHLSLSFRKYGVAIPYKGTLDETPKRPEKRDGTPLDGPIIKKFKVSFAIRQSYIRVSYWSMNVKAGVLPIASKSSTPPPPLPPPPKVVPCCLCLKMEPKLIARCKNCTFAIHPGQSGQLPSLDFAKLVLFTGCYGIPVTDVKGDWLCEPCSNEKNLDASLVRTKRND